MKANRPRCLVALLPCCLCALLLGCTLHVHFHYQRGGGQSMAMAPDDADALTAEHLEETLGAAIGASNDE